MVCVSCAASEGPIYTFPKPVLLLKLCHVGKFGYKEYQRVIQDKHWFCSALASL